jgi:hypothetical protein
LCSRPPDGNTDQLQEDAALLGIRLPDIEDPEEIDFELFPENIPVIEAFFILDGCAWQYTGMGYLIGLDYPAAKIIWNGCGINLSVEDFQGVMLFSRAIVNELNKQRQKK